MPMPAATPSPLPVSPLPVSRLTNTTAFGSNMSLPGHRWFRYSAGFSAQWAEHVIAQTSARRVLDPFAGSGTTLLAAQATGASSIGVDIHPFVARVARAKLCWTAEPAVLLDRAQTALAVASTSAVPALPASPLVQRCFPQPTLVSLCRLRDAVGAVSVGDPCDELLWLALVAILRACSPVGTANWQYVLPNRQKARVADPVAAFSAQIAMMCADMRHLTAVARPAVATYLEEDARSCASVPDGWADLVVTSPPYANNFDYADATRLEMSFLGDVNGWGDLRPLRDKLVRSSSQQTSGYPGESALASALLAPIADELSTVYTAMDAVRRTKGGRKAYHLMAVAYFMDLAQVWHALRRAVTPRGTVCFVVGDSAPYGVHLPVERWLGTLAVAAGFSAWEFEKVRDRNVRWENRKHRVPLQEGRLWVRA